MTSTNKAWRVIQDNASAYTRISNAADTINYMTFQMDTGYIGIGTASPSQLLNVNGSALATAWNTSSDIRLKEHIVPINDPLDKILRLRGVEFDWRNDVNAPTKHEQTHDIGVIAQEVEKVFPEAVTSPKNDGYKSVAYSKLVTPLIEGVKYLYLKFLSHDEQLSTQARQIASLTSEKADNRQVQQLLNENQLKDQEIEKLKNKNLELEKRLQRLEQLMGVSQ